jgi:hypothetical protein
VKVSASKAGDKNHALMRLSTGSLSPKKAVERLMKINKVSARLRSCKK